MQRCAPRGAVISPVHWIAMAARSGLPASAGSIGSAGAAGSRPRYDLRHMPVAVLSADPRGGAGAGPGAPPLEGGGGGGGGGAVLPPPWRPPAPPPPVRPVFGGRP